MTYKLHCVGSTGEKREQGADVNKHGRRHHPYRQLTVRNHDWLLRTDADRLIRLLGRGRVRDHTTTSWPPQQLEVVQPAIDWQRRLPSATPSANDADRRSSHVDAMSWVQEPGTTHGSDTASSAATTRSTPEVQERQQFPVFPPLLGRVFPATTSTGAFLSSSLAYEMLASAALSSLRQAVPFASLLPSSTTTSYDVISAAAALLHSQPHHPSPFMAPPATLDRPRGDLVSEEQSVLDLVVTPSQRGTAAGSEGRCTGDRDHLKHSPSQRDIDDAAPRPRGCVWRPY